MAVGCGAKFAKVMLIIFNIIFLCSGLVLIALGVWLLVTLDQSWGPYQIFKLATDSDLYRNSAILLITMGCFILFVTILGLVAAILESVILLSIFAVLLFLIFAGEIAGGVLAIVYKDAVLDKIDLTLWKKLQFNESDYYEQAYLEPNQCKASKMGKLWDYAQLWFGCCGTGDHNNGYNPKKINPCNATLARWPNMKEKPLTCCPNNVDIGHFSSDNEEEFVDQFNCTYPITVGCKSKVQAWIVKFAPILIGIGIGFGMLEMFGFIFVICLCMNTEKGFKRFHN